MLEYYTLHLFVYSQTWHYKTEILRHIFIFKIINISFISINCELNNIDYF